MLYYCHDSNKAFKEWEILKEFNYEVETSNSSVAQSQLVYFLNSQERPSLTFYKGFTYIFNFQQNQGEDFYISNSPSSSSDSTGELTAGITRSAIPGKSLTFFINQNAPDLLYYHSNSNRGSGGAIKIVDSIPSNLIPNTKISENSISIESDLC